MSMVDAHSTILSQPGISSFTDHVRIRAHVFDLVETARIYFSTPLSYLLHPLIELCK